MARSSAGWRSNELEPFAPLPRRRGYSATSPSSAPYPFFARTTQEAMRHCDPSLTANIYTDPRLLDVHGALEGAAQAAPREAQGRKPRRGHGISRNSPKNPPVPRELLCNIFAGGDGDGDGFGLREEWLSRSKVYAAMGVVSVGMIGAVLSVNTIIPALHTSVTFFSVAIILNVGCYVLQTDRSPLRIQSGWLVDFFSRAQRRGANHGGRDGFRNRAHLTNYRPPVHVFRNRPDWVLQPLLASIESHFAKVRTGGSQEVLVTSAP